MAIVTFWGSGKEQVGKTLAVVALATNMAIEQNKKILVLSASRDIDTIKNCYWSEETIKKSNIFRQDKNAELDNGIEGLAKMIQSNKVSPDFITNYTKIIFKDRLEILLGFRDVEEDEEEHLDDATKAKIYLEIAKTANQYYDIVLVDLDNEINFPEAKEILQRSDLVVTMASQKMSSIKTVQQLEYLQKNRSMLLIGRYDRNSKYTLKNLTRTLGEKNELLAIPYSTLYFEAAQEGTVTDLFLRLRRIEDKNDENALFIDMVKKVTQEIITRVKNSRMMR